MANPFYAPPATEPAPPPSGLSNFTDRARTVLRLAQREREALGQSYVGTEHLLLGLLREGSGVAAGVLKNAGLTFDGLRAETMQLLGRTDPPGRPGRGGRVPRRELRDRIAAHRPDEPEPAGPPVPGPRRPFEPGDLVRHRASGEKAVFRSYAAGDAVYISPDFRTWVRLPVTDIEPAGPAEPAVE